MTESVQKMLTQKVFDVEQNIVGAQSSVDEAKAFLDAAETRLSLLVALKQDLITDLGEPSAASITSLNR